MLAVLFTMLFQSVHTSEHLFDEYFTDSATAVSHHSPEDDSTHFQNLTVKKHTCSICEYTLSATILPEIFTFKSHSTFEAIHYSFTTTATVANSFAGSLFALRAPPTTIC